MLMFNLAISYLTTSNLPWFMHLHSRFLCSIVLYISDFTFTTRHVQNWACFRFGPWSSFFLELFVTALSSTPVTYWTPSDLGKLIFWWHNFFLFYSVAGFSRKIIGVGCHSLLQWTTFCQNFQLWPVCHGWASMAWVIALSSYISHLATTRLQSMKKLI